MIFMAIILVLCVFMLYKIHSYEKCEDWSFLFNDEEFCRFSFGTNYNYKTDLQRLEYWNRTYGHELKFHPRTSVNYSLKKMYEYYIEKNKRSRIEL